MTGAEASGKGGWRQAGGGNLGVQRWHLPEKSVTSKPIASPKTAASLSPMEASSTTVF